MRKAMLALTVFGLLAAGSMTACTDDSGGTGSSGNSGGGTGNGAKGGATGAKIGVIMPDETTSQRWTTDDPRYLKLAFDAADVKVDIQNAKGDKARFVALADQMINEGVKVLIIVSLDSPTGKTVLAKARAAKVKTIDYDRLTLNGGADYYVSFDNVGVGVQQANGLVDCLKAEKAKNPVVAELNGSPTDNNATLFKQGYDSVLQPKYDDALYTKGPDQSVPDWDNGQGGKMFEQMWQHQNQIRGVLAANDGLAGAVIDVLKTKKMNGKVPVTGQDATVEGLQRILSGDQCMTVYKAIRPEAEAAAKLAVNLYKNQPINQKTIGQTIDKIKDPESGAYIQFVSLTSEAINKSNVQRVVADGFVTKKALCVKQYAQLCVEHDIK
jgi:D-xylose transport system substrate-binding protein